MVELEIKVVVVMVVVLEVEIKAVNVVVVVIVVVVVQLPRAWAVRQLRGCQKQTMWHQRAHDRNTPRLQGPTCCTGALTPSPADFRHHT